MELFLTVAGGSTVGVIVGNVALAVGLSLSQRRKRKQAIEQLTAYQAQVAAAAAERGKQAPTA
jgi:hypothetical protein